MKSARMFLGWYVVLGFVGFVSAQQEMTMVQLDLGGETVAEPEVPIQSPDADQAQEYLERTSQDVLSFTQSISPQFEQQTRFLQTPLDVNLTCASYNNDPSGLYNCTCIRQGRYDVRAECTIDQRLCNSDNTTCWEQRFTVVLDGVAAEGQTSLPASVMTTCTTQLSRALDSAGNTFFTPAYETCIEIQPTTPGFFNETVLCGAAVDGRLCKSCKQCAALLSNETRITVDCCNVQKDAQATCTSISQVTGLAFPSWDAAGSHPGCNGSGAGSIGSITALLVTLMAGMGILLL